MRVGLRALKLCGPMALVLCLTVASVAYGKAAPEARTQQLVAALKARHAQPAAAGGAEKNPRDAELDNLFDFDRLGADPIAPHRKAFSPAQLKTFTQIFRDLIREKALHAGGAFADGQLTIGVAKAVGQQMQVEVHVVNPDKDVDSRITFLWETTSADWRVVDVALDGSSIVKDYQNQFGRILKKSGPDVLIGKIRGRLDEARKAP